MNPVSPIAGGVIPPLATPFTTDFQLDLDALDRLLARLLAVEIDGLFLLGTTSEGLGLSRDTKRRVVSEVIQRTAGKVPILVNVTDCSIEESVGLARFSAGLGAVGVAFSPPFYFPISQDELLYHCRALAQQLPVPFFLYNMPSHARPPFAVETVRALADLPNAAGLKDSSGDAAYLADLLEAFRDRPGFRIFLGPEDKLVESFEQGAHGSVCGSANLMPEPFVRLWKAFQAGRREEAMQAQSQILLLHRIYQAASGSSSYLRALKCGLALQGVCQDILLPPHFPLSPVQREQVRAALEAAGVRA